jgi:sugar lactone lactonase YvrE
MRAAAVFFVGLLVVGTEASAQDLWSKPESVAFDEANDRYLVSNDGDGTIVALDADGNQSYFQTGFSFALGTQIVGNTLYVTVNWNRILGFDLSTGETVMDLAASGNVDGMTWDGGNYLYVVGSSGLIYKVDIAAQSHTNLGVTGLAVSPQDIVFDGANNRLLVVHWNSDAATTVRAIDLSDLSVSQAMANAPTLLDGISMSADGKVFLSSHTGGGKVFLWNGEHDGLALPIMQGLNEPAGSCYNERDDVLAVACYGGDSVAFVSFADSDEDAIPWLWDNCPESYNPTQFDSDWDGVGDACDECTDTDGDGYGDPGFSANTCEQDNCPIIPNAYQSDLDSDNVGDECDNCIFAYNPEQEDIDENQIGDVCEGCCVGRVGDANGLGGDEPTIGDISVLIDAKFITGTCDGILDCFTEADVNQSGGLDATCDDITIGDISTLIDYLFITGLSLGLAECL